jgi:GNAT superfamily N-acetyltransferase
LAERTVSHDIRIRQLQELTEADIAGLAALLCDCVAGGASVSFMAPLSQERAAQFWRSLKDGVSRGERLLLAALDDSGTFVGTVQLHLALPENQPHRADLAKMLVHRSARRHGVGAALLEAAESAALAAGRTLLVLDTASADAERLYVRRGWQRVGQIPDYALLPDGGPCATTIFYKSLAP